MPEAAQGCALVTGGGSGIGRAVASALAASGRRVALVARERARLDEAASAINLAAGRDAALPFPADVTDAAALARAFDGAASRFGPIEALVNAAGIAESAPFTRTDAAALRRHLEVNVVGAHAAIALAWPSMTGRGAGSVINVASAAGLEGFAYTTAYTASKHALVGLTRALAKEAAPRGIRVNALCPGFVDTPMLDRSIEGIVAATGRTREEARASLAAMNGGGRLLDPGEIARVALWLLDGGGRDLNGEAVLIDARPGPWDEGEADDAAPLPVNPERLGEARGYSNGMLMRAGRTLFVAGQVAWDREHRIVGGEDFAAQFDAALGNVLAVVREAGGSPQSVGRLRIYVSDRERYLAALPGVGRAYRAKMGRHYPAMALVEVSRLLEEGALVEIEAEAIL